SWVPWIIMLPLGSTAVTTAAMVSLIFSDRFTEPAPALEVVEPVFTALAGSNPPGNTRPRLDSRPKKFSTPAWVLAVRDELVALVVLAESSISICTVRMSPTRLARWSLKKARAPERQSELAEAGWGAGSRAEARLMISCCWGTRTAV